MIKEKWNKGEARTISCVYMMMEFLEPVIKQRINRDKENILSFALYKRWLKIALTQLNYPQFIYKNIKEQKPGSFTCIWNFLTGNEWMEWTREKMPISNKSVEGKGKK